MNGDTITENTDNDRSFPFKIAVITDHPSVNEDDFHSPSRLITKYGSDKIVHVTWPEDFMAEQDKMIETAAKLANDRDIKALIINQAVEGSNAAVDKLKEARDDLYIIYCNTNEKPSEAATRANLIFSLNELGMGAAMVRQARKQGAKSFVHYSSPRHMSNPILSSRRDLIREECQKGDVLFADATAHDPAGEVGLTGSQQFILEDVPRLTAKYGQDTAFFCTYCQLQTPLIKAVVGSHAIFPQPCCPSPYHGFPEALGIEINDGNADLNYVIGEACRIAEEKNMTDRLSTWPVSSSMMFTNAGAEYAIRWLMDEVPKTGIDSQALVKCMKNYIIEVVGEESSVYMSSYSEGGKIYDNYKLILMSYLDF